MPLGTINGRDGSADFTIAGQSYKTVLREFEFEANQQLVDVTTFNEEGTTLFDPGQLIGSFRCAGLLKKGGAAADGMIIPQIGVNQVLTFSTGCTLTFSATYERTMIRRTVNDNGVITAEGRATGAIVKAWVVT